MNYSRNNTYAYAPRERNVKVSDRRDARMAASQMRVEDRLRREEAMKRRAAAEAENARLNEMRRRRYERDLARVRAYEAKMKREQAAVRKAEKAKAKEAARLAEEAARRNEIKVERVKMPWQFILGVAIAFVLLMAMVFSFAQISETNARLAAVKSEIKAAEDEADKLKIRLEDKNDLTEIERLAVEEYNMVKESSVQKKYIYVSDGDRVVIEADENEASANTVGGGMLSSVSSMFDDLLDYIK